MSYIVERSIAMPLIRWEPAREINSLQGEVNRLFNTFFDTPSNGATSTRRWIPAMDLVEAGDHYVLRADLPGLAEEDVNIEVADDVLTVSGERRYDQEASEGGYVRVERAFGAFKRTLSIPDGIDPEAVTASFDNGVLEVRVPKPEERKPRRVAIKVGDTAPALEGSESS
jgi:HSP20 family protein